MTRDHGLHPQSQHTKEDINVLTHQTNRKYLYKMHNFMHKCSCFPRLAYSLFDKLFSETNFPPSSLLLSTVFAALAAFVFEMERENFNKIILKEKPQSILLHQPTHTHKQTHTHTHTFTRDERSFFRLNISFLSNIFFMNMGNKYSAAHTLV
jgi:hypothetical protein